MLPRRKRLEKSSFSFVFSRGRSCSSANFVLKTAKLPGGKGGCAVVVSKKVAKTAVARNRMRRRVYEIVRKISLPDTEAFVFVAKRDIKDLKHQDLFQEISRLINPS